ncbi:MAG TPA: radical SAM protein, partial [Pyrinomonadaceae bacterium]
MRTETTTKKLVLVMPPQLGLLKGFSNGLIGLANYVAERLTEVQIELLDLSTVPGDQVEGHINHYRDVSEEIFVVGITTTTASYQSALWVARNFKTLVPKCVIVFGGHHASADAETVLRYHSETVDFIIKGEGEHSLAEFMNSLGGPKVFSTPGLAFMHNGNFYQNIPPSFLNQKELDSLAITFNGGGLIGTPGKFEHATYVSARGCPLRCSFCSVANEKIRSKSVPRVIQDIREMITGGYSRIAIEDNFFAHSPARTKELCIALTALRAEGLKFSWDCQTRIESMVREEVVGLLADAGCEAVYIGVESLNEYYLRYLNKTSQPQRYLAQLVNVVVPRLLASPVNCYLNLQFGLPGESDEHSRHTFRVLQELGSMAIREKKCITIFPQLHVVYPDTHQFRAGVVEGRFGKDVFETFTEWEAQQPPVKTWLGEH